MQSSEGLDLVPYDLCLVVAECIRQGVAFTQQDLYLRPPTLEDVGPSVLWCVGCDAPVWEPDERDRHVCRECYEKCPHCLHTCYPCYGRAPHGWVVAQGSAVHGVPLPRDHEAWGNFLECSEAGEEGMGTYTHCLQCGHGMSKEEILESVREGRLRRAQSGVYLRTSKELTLQEVHDQLVTILDLIQSSVTSLYRKDGEHLDLIPDLLKVAYNLSPIFLRLRQLNAAALKRLREGREKQRKERNKHREGTDTQAKEDSRVPPGVSSNERVLPHPEGDRAGIQTEGSQLRVRPTAGSGSEGLHPAGEREGTGDHSPDGS